MALTGCNQKAPEQQQSAQAPEAPEAPEKGVDRSRAGWEKMFGVLASLLQAR